MITRLIQWIKSMFSHTVVSEPETMTMVVVTSNQGQRFGWLTASNPDTGRSQVCVFEEVSFSFKTFWTADEFLTIREVA